jgi:pilus assembly protein FimV
MDVRGERLNTIPGSDNPLRILKRLPKLEGMGFSVFRMLSRTFILLWALLAPFQALALGLGEIRVDSALNEPLDARIKLLSLDPLEAPNIRVVIADQDAFEKAGLERPYLLKRLRFKVVADRGGDGYIHVSTPRSVKEPYLNFLLEVRWRGGMLLREYAILLDPPSYRLARIPVQTAAPAPRAEAIPAVPRKRPDTYRVRPTETLWIIAEKVRSKRTYSVEQVMLALQRRNPDAFLDNNVNRVKSGSLLALPDDSEVESMGRAEARREFLRQTREWQEEQARLRPAAAPGVAESAVAEAPTQEDVTPPEQPPEAETRDEEAELKIVEAVEEGKEVLASIDRGEGDPDQQVQQLQAAIQNSREELASVREINQELDQLRVTLEKEIGALRDALHERDAVIDELIKRMEQEDAARSVLQDSGAETDVPATPPAPVAEDPGAIETSLAARGVEPESPMAGVQPDAAQEGVQNIWIKGLSIIVILVMLTVIFLLLRSQGRGRREEEASVLFDRVALPEVVIKKESYDGLYRNLKEQEHAERAQSADQGGQPREEPVDVLLTDEFLEEVERERADEEESEPEGITTAKSDVGAILTEADVYLIYRQYPKAEALIHECLQKHPRDIELMAKLLEIYASQKAKAQFVAYLDETADSIKEGDPDVWRGVEELGKALVPEHPLFNRGEPSPPEDDFSLEPGLLEEELEVTSSGAAAADEKRSGVKGDKGLDSFDLDIDLDLDDSDQNKGR